MRVESDSMRSTIGYLLHAWKNLSYSPATILNDEQISDSPEGGTGKGFIYKCFVTHEEGCCNRW
jgi:hypothetical protein